MKIRMRSSAIGHAFQSRLQSLHNRAERMFLDEIEQPLFGFEVVVKSRQRHAALAREIAHRGAFIALLAEDFGGVSEDFSQTPVVAGGRTRSRRDVVARKLELLAEGLAILTTYASLIRTFVRIEYTRCDPDHKSTRISLMPFSCRPPHKPFQASRGRRAGRNRPRARR